tara:strand:+ start:3975 stop:4736 length:762 start_codon:yes stop_codon:yes gene_type:complete
MIKHFFILSAITLSLLSCSKEEGEGGRSSISGTITGTEITTARAEVTEITAIPGHEIKKQEFFLLNTPNPSANYAIWFRDVDNITGSPIIAGRTLIKIDYSNSASTNINIAESIESAISTISGSPFTVTRTNDFLSITNSVIGYVNDADNATSDLIIDVATQGRPQITLQNGAFADEDVYIIYGDDDDIFDDNVKTNFDGTFKFSNLRKGSYKVFAYSKDESNISTPLTPIFGEKEIGGNEDAQIGTITIEKK